MPKYIPTGKARVYEDGVNGYIETDLETAKAVYAGQAGFEVYSLMREVDGE